MVDDWLAHTPKDIIAKNFGVNASVFGSVPTPDPYIINGTVSTQHVSGGNGELTGDSSYVYRTLQKPGSPVPGGAGTFRKIDSTNFPISKTLAAAVVTLQPGGLRELHWHPNVRMSRLLPVLWLTSVVLRLKNGCTSTKVKLVLLSLSATPTLEPLTFLPVTLLRFQTTLGK
jgi:Cupin